MGNWKRYLLSVLLFVFVGLLVVYFAFPEVLLWLAKTSARYSARCAERDLANLGDAVLAAW